VGRLAERHLHVYLVVGWLGLFVVPLTFTQHVPVACLQFAFANSCQNEHQMRLDREAGSQSASSGAITL